MATAADRDGSAARPQRLRLRLISIDYSMAPPRAEVDAPARITAPSAPYPPPPPLAAVPVLRLIGATEAGRSVCLHVHQVFPYLFVPCPEHLTSVAQGG